MQPEELDPMAVKPVSAMRILIVEDDSTMRALLHSLLLALGARQIGEAPDGERGLAMLNTIEPDLILTDYSMKPIDGAEFVKRLRRLPPPMAQIPVIMITGHAERQYVEQARDAGVTEFLCKPVTARDLNTRIQEIFSHPRQFVKTETFAGPDRRRRRAGPYKGPRRRQSDRDVDLEFQ
jgi:two-component system chemotaxis response regulator CheY